MSALERRKNYLPPELGLNSRFIPSVLNEREAATLENYQVNSVGLLEKYPGYTKDGSPFPNNADSFIRTLYNFRRGATINQLLIVAQDDANTNSTYGVDIKSTIGDGTYSYLTFGIGTATFTHGNTAVVGTLTSWLTELKSGDKIKLASDPDADYTEIATVNSNTSLTLVAGGYLGTTAGSASAYLARKIWSTNNLVSITTFNNVAIFVDGNGVAQQYNGSNIFNLINSYSGTTVTTQPNPAPIASFVTRHKNRVFMLDSIGNLTWSHANDQTFWDPASIEPVFPSDGGTAVGFKSFADSIFVFKDNGNVYRVFGNFDDSPAGTPAAIIRVDYTEKIGLIASRSICIHNNLLYFIAQTGIYTIDQRGYMQKISLIIDPTTQTLNFGTTSTTSKSFPFTNTAQWNTGTHHGSYSNSANQTLQGFFDDFRQVDAKINTGLCSIAIGTDNTLHVAYVPNSNADQINYVRYRVNGSTLGGNAIQKETSILMLDHGVVNSVAIGVSPVDQTVGILYSIRSNIVYYVERTPDIQSPFSYGTWGGPVTAHATSDFVNSVVLTFSSGGDPIGACLEDSPDSAHSGRSVVVAGCIHRSSGVWSLNEFYSQNNAVLTQGDQRIAIALDGSSNIYISFIPYTTLGLFAYKSTNGGTSFSQVEVFTPASLNTQTSLSIGFNHAGNYITTYSENSGAVVRRNHTTTSSTTLSTVANTYCGGWFTIYDTIDTLNLDTDYYWQIGTTTGSQNETFVSRHSASTGYTLNNTTTNTINNTPYLRPTNTPYVNNGQTSAMIAFGTNANEIIIRRVSFFGWWDGPEQSDATLTAWGTFVVGTSSQVFEYEVALASAHPATSFTTITNGSIVSSNPAFIFNIPRVVFALTSWGGFSLTSLILNYTGSGVTSNQLFGISYYNEAFFAGTRPGSQTNNVVVVQDIKNAFLTNTYPVNCMETFNTFLYAGSATNGDLYKLKTGTSFNGSAYTSTFVSKEDFLQFIELEKDIYKIYILYQVQSSGTFDFSYRLDNFKTGNAPWTTVTVNQTATSNSPDGPGVQEVPIGAKARSIQYRVQDANNNNYSGIIGWILVYGGLNLR